MDRARTHAHRYATASSAALIAALACGMARADTPPTVWDLAKNPDAFAQRRQHLAIERHIDLYDELEGEVSLISRAASADAKEATRSLAESWRGPKDEWLRFDDAWVAMRGEDYARAVSILEPLTKQLGVTMFAQEVWMKLAESYVRLERTKDEIHAYDEVLARSMTDGQRATPLMNQGEALMRDGDANAALAQFREVARLAVASTDLSILTQWDIVIALDRSGDFGGALQAALATVRMSKAAVLYLQPLNPAVYFVPAYERSWYLALAEAGLALDATQARAVAHHWKSSETYMMSYVSGATTNASDKWLELARKRLDEIRKRRAEAEKRPGALAPPGEEMD